MRQLAVSIGILIFTFSAFAERLTIGPESRFVECQSKNVWDAGYVMSFDLASYEQGANAQIGAHLFELVPLWRKNLVYSGMMQQVRLIDDVCQFELLDRIVEPTSRISFKSEAGQISIRLNELGGKKIDQWGELECQKALVELLTAYCKQLASR